MSTEEKELDMKFNSDMKTFNQLVAEFKEKFKKNVIGNKRIWRYVFLYFALFGVTYKICNPWYQLIKKKKCSRTSKNKREFSC